MMGDGGILGPAGEYNIIVNLLKIAGSQVTKLTLLFLDHAKCCNLATLYTKPGK